jgi:Arc/MetJ-type ribon-helix-helix transcriptional regulator
MKHATVTIPDDLERAVDSYVRSQDVPPPLTAVVQAALREYLAQRGFLQRPVRRLRIAQHPRAAGGRISVNHMIAFLPLDEAFCAG